MISTQNTSRCRWRRFPFQFCGVSLPKHATRLPLRTHCNPSSASLRNSLGAFHHSLTASLASFANRVSAGDHASALWPGCWRVDPASTRLTQGRLRLHTALRADDAMHRIAGFAAASYTDRKYRDGSTSVHKNRSPRKQGQGYHAIGNCPGSASVR